MSNPAATSLALAALLLAAPGVAGAQFLDLSRQPRRGAPTLLDGSALDPAERMRDATIQRRTSILSAVVEKLVADARDAVEEGRYAEAERILARADRAGLNPHEVAVLHQMDGFLHARRGQRGPAVASFEQALAQSGLDPLAANQIRYDLVRLYLANRQSEQALAALATYFAETDEPGAEAFYLLAVAHTSTGHLEEALGSAREAVARAEVPEAPWLQLLIGLFLRSGEIEAALEPAGQLVALYGEKAHWLQLAGVYGRLGRREEAFETLARAHERDLLDSDGELRLLADLFRDRGQFDRAGELLEEGIAGGVVRSDAAAWELLGRSWLDAGHTRRAIDPLRRAIEGSPDAELSLLLGRAYLEEEEWERARGSLETALAGDLEAHGHALLLLGIAQYHARNLAAAERSFQQALAHPDARDSASDWIDQLERERP